jgi:hypothetical protein
MKARLAVALILAGIALAAAIALLQPSRDRTPNPKPQPPQQTLAPEPPLALSPQPATAITESVIAPAPSRPLPAQASVIPAAAEAPLATTNKLERLAQIRESFHALASGDPAAAFRAAKQITNETERETALLCLVTEWTRGELGPPRERARAIADYGIEAGLGMELARHPELAVLWANELSDAQGRLAILRETAVTMAGSDPAAAFALGDQIPEADRPKFFDGVFADWGGRDTEAALRWAGQLPEPAARDAALTAIRTEAPVGIGAALALKDGLPVINQVIPGTPAELSGQLHPGDRILALAQGDNAFLDAHNISLQDLVNLVRGSPGTLLQLQVLSADAPPDSPPRTVSIIRDQLKFKR